MVAVKYVRTLIATSPSGVRVGLYVRQDHHEEPTAQGKTDDAGAEADYCIPWQLAGIRE